LVVKGTGSGGIDAIPRKENRLVNTKIGGRVIQLRSADAFPMLYRTAHRVWSSEKTLNETHTSRVKGVTDTRTADRLAVEMGLRHACHTKSQFFAEVT